jgi:hypothetical protein
MYVSTINIKKKTRGDHEAQYFFSWHIDFKSINYFTILFDKVN